MPRPEPEGEDHEGPDTSAELLVVDGPQAGSRALLGDAAATIGSSRSADLVLNGIRSFIAPEHVRVWQHGGHYVLRQLDHRGILINGQPMLMPLVILDDGDEIGIGGYRIRFACHSSS